MYRLLLLASLSLAASLGATAHAVVHSAPSGFVVRPDISDPLCNGGLGVRLAAGLRGDAAVASATMSDGSTWVAFSEVYPGKRLAVLRSITRRCTPDLDFGQDGTATISLPSHLKRRPAVNGMPSEGLWISALAPRTAGGAIVAGVFGDEWIVGEVTRSGNVVRTFGNGGWAVLPFHGDVTAVLQEKSGRILIAGDNGGGGCCTRNWAAALSSRGVLDRRFGRNGRTELPTGEDSGVESLARERNGDILAEIGYGNMGCWGEALAMLTSSGKPVPQFKQRLERFWRGLGYGAFVGTVSLDSQHFTLVGTGQKPCASGPSFSAPSASGIIERFDANGKPSGSTVRFPSRLYGYVHAFHIGDDILVAGSPYADPTRIAVIALRRNGSRDSRFGNDGRVSIRTPWRGFNAALETAVSIMRAGPNAITIVATESGKFQLIRVRL